MKIPLILALISISFTISCKDDDLDPGSPTATSYITLTVGSSRSYELKNNTPPTSITNSTVTSTNRDTTVNGRSYHVFSTSTGGSEYYAQSGGDYYTYQILPIAIGTTNVEILYLKDNANVGATWVAASAPLTLPGVPFPLTITINNTLAEKGLSRTVNGKNYTDVIHVSSTIGVSGLPGGITSDIHYYYAPKYGLIENSVILSSSLAPIAVDTDTRLMTANF